MYLLCTHLIDNGVHPALELLPDLSQFNDVIDLSQIVRPAVVSGHTRHQRCKLEDVFNQSFDERSKSIWILLYMESVRTEVT